MGARILVIGATGTVGRRVVEGLLERGAQPYAATRDVSKAQQILGKQVECVPFDLTRHETFAPALREIDGLFLSARPGDPTPEVHANVLLDAAVAASVRRVVDLSAMGAERRPEFGLRKVEQYLETLGIAFCHLRPNWFYQVFAAGSLLGGIRRGVLALPAGDALISYVDARDVAAVAVRALLGDIPLDRGYTLTGPSALSHQTVASVIAAARGSLVSYVPLSEEEAQQGLRAAGFPEPWVDRLIGFYRLVRQGACAEVNPDMASLLGRVPVSLDAFVMESASLFR